MKIILTKQKIINLLKKSEDVGFVPTMGAIHKGHLSLVKKSISQCNKTVVSIFINKPQFNQKRDYMAYPRKSKKDISILKKYKIDYLYLPKNKHIYPKGPNKKIKISSLKKILCGKSRPGHFEAVVDVIERFIKIIKPSKIFLGEKDFQQLKILEDYVKKNKIKTKIVQCKTIREKNGMAYSSRNTLLNLEQKNKASRIYKLIYKIKKKLIKKKIKISFIKKQMQSIGAKIDYLEIRDVNKFVKPFKKSKKYKIFFAYYLGSIRLIDNI